MVDFAVVDSRIFALDDKVGWENSRAKAEECKTKAFGLVSNILFGADREDIDVKYVERRYEPFWHILCTTHMEYNRGRQYKIDVDDVVRKVVVDGTEHEVEGEFVLNGTEYCAEDLRKEVFIDASTGASGNFSRYVDRGKREIKETEELMTGETIVVPAKVKASYLTRNLISEMLKPVKADEVTCEQIRMEKLHLYFRPVYAFEYLLKTKNKTATLELDAVTGETKAGGKALRQKMGEFIIEADLFDIGTDVVNLFVPGGGLAMKIARRAMKKKK